MCKFISLFILMGIVSSCYFCGKNYDSILKNLDAQLERKPEMVLDSLNKMNPEQLSNSQKAYYHLLKASAKDKNFVYLENDSTLRISYDYYQGKKDLYNMARCEYYLGKYQQKRKRIKNAYNLFKQAEQNAQESPKEDLHLLGLIFYQLGVMQQQQNNIFESKVFFEKAYANFIEIQDTISAIHALRYKGIIELNYNKNSVEAEKDLFHGLELSTKININSLKALESKGHILSSISYFYRKQKDFNRSLEYCRKCIALYDQSPDYILSQYYYNTAITFLLQKRLDSARYYSYKTIEIAKIKKNHYNLLNGHKLLAKIKEKEGDYKEAYNLKDYYNNLKDSVSRVITENDIIDLEKRYENADTQRKLFQAENDKLKAYALISVIILGITAIGLPLYFRHQKLKSERDQLFKTVKHKEWGFLVTKEFITENHIAYDELERILNREKSLHNINTEMYNKLHEALIQQKANYSGRLFNRLTDFDGSFVTKFQQLFPDSNTDELLLAMMIHHQWKLIEMAPIFHVSVEALRKRKARLAHKISGKLKQDIDLEEYLSRL